MSKIETDRSGFVVSFRIRSCCPECKPYYVIVLAFVCGGAALLALMSLATMITMDIGVLPKGKSTSIVSSEHQRFNFFLLFFSCIGYERILSDADDETVPNNQNDDSVAVVP